MKEVKHTPELSETLEAVIDQAKRLIKERDDLKKELFDLKGTQADYNASLHGWKASFEGEQKRHEQTTAERYKFKSELSATASKLEAEEKYSWDLVKDLIGLDRMNVCR